MLPQYFVYISIATSLFAGYFYIRDMVRGETKPNRVSWLIWCLAPIIASFISFSKGAGISVLPVFMAGVIPLLVLSASVWNKNAYWELGILDYICFTLALVSLLSWVFLKEGTLATIFAILADLIAFVPTYVKSWRAPDTESISAYGFGSFNAVLSISTLTVLSFNTFGFAMYLLLGNLLEIVIVLYRRKMLKKRG